MPSTFFLTALLALSGAVYANPVPPNAKPGHPNAKPGRPNGRPFRTNVNAVLSNMESVFSVEQVESTMYLKNGPGEMVKTLRKYNKAVPENLLEAMENRANVFSIAATTNGSAPAVPNDDYDSSYLSPVTAGGTTLQLTFDTGSSDLYVPVPCLDFVV